MVCIICEQEIEPDVTGWDKGNNPAPWPNDTVAHIIMESHADEYRCCNDCNNLVVALRIQRAIQH